MITFWLYFLYVQLLTAPHKLVKHEIINVKQLNKLKTTIELIRQVKSGLDDSIVKN